jgi:hypothetical protein
MKWYTIGSGWQGRSIIWEFFKVDKDYPREQLFYPLEDTPWKPQAITPDFCKVCKRPPDPACQCKKHVNIWRFSRDR